MTQRNEHASLFNDDNSKFPALLTHLHRGGTWGYWWCKNGARRWSEWWKVGSMILPSAGNHDVYFGVHPTTEIPKANHLGDPAEPCDVRAQIPYIVAVNALFAEYDAKDYSDKAGALAHVDGLNPPPSYVVDSGGGYHAYWLLAETWILSDEAERQRARDVQGAWVAYVGGDKGAKDLARVLRVPGTHNHKYPDRPTVRVIQAEPGRVYALADLVQRMPDPKRETRPGQSTRGDGETPVQKWAAAALAGEREKVERAVEGTRNDTLNRAAFALGQIVGGGALDRTTAETELEQAARSTGLSERETQTTIRSGIEAGIAEPRQPIRRAAKETQRIMETTEPDELLRHGPDDEGNAQTVAYLHGEHFTYSPAYGWLLNTGTHWTRDGAEATLDRAIVATLIARRQAAVQAEAEAIVKTSRPTARRVKDCRYMLASILHTAVDEFDGDPNTLNCANGVIDLRDGSLHPHESGQRFTYCCPVEYDPKADPTPWVDFLRAALGNDQALIDYVQEAVGYSLTGHTSEEVLFFLHGPTRAGKGTFTETLLTMMGHRPLADEVDFSTFSAKRDGESQNFDLAGLKPCRFVVASESGKYSMLNPAALKRLTGGNLIRCAFKHRDHFSYRPAFKVWLASNHAPNVDVDDNAAWYRVRVIHFPNSYAGREDKALKGRLIEPANLAGVLAWAVAGAIAWTARGTKGLQTPAPVEVATQAAREQLDFVAQWLTECVVSTKQEDDFVTNAALYSSYETWCNNNGVTPKKQRSLTQALLTKGLEAGKQKKVEGRNYKGLRGARLQGNGNSQ